MRISKKFVGSNCIGKQVFRRKNFEMNKLTMEELQKSRTELTELERKFLDRVSQSTRCKAGPVSGKYAPYVPAGDDMRMVRKMKYCILDWRVLWGAIGVAAPSILRM